MIAIVDYGVGNLYSLWHSLKYIGCDCVVTSDVDTICSADKLILPGVGAFKNAADKLKISGLDNVIKSECARGKPLLGICLGMQLLFDKSYEYGETEGLKLIEGEIVPISDYVKDLKIPHMGWNSLNLSGSCPIFGEVRQGEFVYFVHSYFAKCPKKYVAATCDYGIEITAAVQNGNVFGTQFHPEKSGEVGLKILNSFANL